MEPIFTPIVDPRPNSGEGVDAQKVFNEVPRYERRARTVEYKAKRKLEERQLANSWMAYALIVLWLVVLQTAGVAYFTKGFLLTRPVFEEKSVCSENPLDPALKFESGCWSDKTYDKAVIFVIDALRFDFVVPSPKLSLEYHNTLTVLHEYAEKYPQHALLTKFMADPPTTTLQRLKGLTTGSLPTFIDAGSNFAGTEIEEDNWIAQLTTLDKTIGFMGDDTWTALFGRHFLPNMSHPFDSLNVWDLHTVDNGVITNLFPALERSDEWDVLIAHSLGVDHAGHRYGPNHHAMKDKLRQMDQVIRDVIDKIDDRTLLVVMGDHGMDSKGDHGGDTLPELESTLWMYSKKANFERISNQNARHLYKYTIDNDNVRTVDQIDLVPTLSLLLGLPIPYNSLGLPIIEAFSHSQHDYINQLTAAQIRRYRANFDDTPDTAWSTYEKSLSASVSRTVSAQKYQKDTLAELREKWVKFDMNDMYIGIGILTAALLVVVSFYARAGSFKSLTILKFISLVAVVGGALGHVYGTYSSNPKLYTSLLGAAIGIAGGSLQMVGRFVATKGWKPESPWTVLAIVFAIIHSAAFSSNSFTIWEPQILQFLLVTFGVVTFALSFRLDNVKGRTWAAWHSAVFIGLTKLSSMMTLCREEQGGKCFTTFYTELSSVNPPIALAALVAATFILPQIIKSFYQTSASYQGSAPVWIGFGLRIIMVIVALYWTLDGIETYGWNKGAESTIWTAERLQTVKIILARIVLGATLVAANYAWFIGGALCVQVEMREAQDSGPRALIMGYSNVYGTFYMLVVLNFFAACLIVSKPYAGVMLSVLIYQILTLLELVDLFNLRRSPLPPVVLDLLGSYYFFTTGHNATLPAIQWEIGFVPVTTITFPLTHFAIFLNTFAPLVLTVLSAPLVAIWKVQPSKHPIGLHSLTVSSTLATVAYYSLTTLISMVSTLALRRHLMLWKIFAPRYMLAGIAVGAANLVGAIAVALSGRCISYIDSIFG
ncbi:GPI ethanolamine phosphate transferase 3 [Trichomonascus vanleenenianus]|uniref:mannose-ethanolamine phosphotransferase GPI13 n=1 Tax=Trichomonascus vanleenenianus TaxID=2268995 RepID=UPI003ECA415D